MYLRGIDFGHVFNASGARGFHGEGYWYHRVFRPFGLSFEGSTFAAKTTPLAPRVGNMPLRSDGITPIERMPKCIVVNLRKGIVLNAVGLSSPGAIKIIKSGYWFRQEKPFVMSFMAVGKTKKERLEELCSFVLLVEYHDRYFRAPFALEINYACPNVGLHLEELTSEIHEGLEIAGILDRPIIIKLNATIAVEIAKQISDHETCEALTMSNTIPWGALPDRIDWRGLFGSDISPLAHLGGGGLSGAPLLPIVTDWIRAARKNGIEKPIIGGGGILLKKDALQMIHAGATASSLGTVCILRPWRVQGIINFANRIYHAYGTR